MAFLRGHHIDRLSLGDELGTEEEVPQMAW
jgi:hypothetical protein